MRTLPKEAVGLQKRVLRLIAKKRDATGIARLSLVDIASALRSPKSSVEKAIILLRKKGILLYTEGKSYKKSAYQIADDVNSTRLPKHN